MAQYTHSPSDLPILIIDISILVENISNLAAVYVTSLMKGHTC